MRGGWGLRVGASRNVQVLRCILRCLFITLNRPLKILVGHLPVMFIGYDRGVTKEGRRHVSRVLARQVSCHAGSQVLEELWPRCQPRLADDPKEVGAEVHARIPVPRNDMFLTGLGLVPSFLQVWTELWENRYPTLPFALVPFSFGAGDTDSAAVPIEEISIKMFYQR
jgi:hypothetical protein